MAYSEEIRLKVRTAYVINGVDLETAACTAAVKFSTAKRWKYEARRAGDDWDKARTAWQIAGDGQEDAARQMLAMAMRQIQTVLELLQKDEALPATERVRLLASLADASFKLISSNRRMMPETDALAVAMRVIKMLGDYIAKHYPELAASYVTIMEPFGEYLARELGNGQ